MQADNTAREFLSQISGIQLSTDSTDLEKLTLFLEAARKLNTAGVLDEILITLLDATLKLTRAERGYVFMKAEDGSLSLSAGRNSKGEPLLDDKTISHSILDEAIKSNSEFVITDTSQSLNLAGRQSIVAYDLRTVICIPLRKPQVQTTRDSGGNARRHLRRGDWSALRGLTFRLARHLQREQRYSPRLRDRGCFSD